MNTPSSNNTKPERNERLLALVAAPTIWVLHFLASYLTAAVWCAKYSDSSRSFHEVRAAIATYTVLALAGILIIGVNAYRRHRYQGEPLPHDDDTPEDRHRFLGFATLLLAWLSAVATLFVAAVAVFVRTCD